MRPNLIFKDDAILMKVSGFDQMNLLDSDYLVPALIKELKGLTNNDDKDLVLGSVVKDSHVLLRTIKAKDLKWIPGKDHRRKLRIRSHFVDAESLVKNMRGVKRWAKRCRTSFDPSGYDYHERVKRRMLETKAAMLEKLPPVTYTRVRYVKPGEALKTCVLNRMITNGIAPEEDDPRPWERRCMDFSVLYQHPEDFLSTHTGSGRDKYTNEQRRLNPNRYDGGYQSQLAERLLQADNFDSDDDFADLYDEDDEEDDEEDCLMGVDLMDIDVGN